jgi:predicted peptidase
LALVACGSSTGGAGDAPSGAGFAGQSVGEGTSAAGGSGTAAGSGGAGSQSTGASGSGSLGGTGASGGGGGALPGVSGSDAGGANAGGSAQGGSAQGGAGQAGSASCGQPNTSVRLIAFGTTLDPTAQVCESKALAQSLANPNAAQWRAKGDQKRSYRFKAANADVPYRVVVPTSWDGSAKLPLVMFLHGAGNDESSYLDQNNKQMVNLAQQRGYLLVSPLGYQGAYGNFLRLPAVFGQPAEAAKKIAEITPETEATNELSEKDVINVLELVLNEYPIDRTAMFLTGHSMGSGGTWYIGDKYADYWAALAPMSGPFVQETGYLWDDLRRMPLLVTEGTQATSVAGSHVLRDWLMTNGFKSQYIEVNADHPGMVPLVLPNVFTFFDDVRKQ